MRWDSRLDRLERRLPPAPRIDLKLRELLGDMARQYGGTWEDGRLTAVNFLDGETYQLGSDGAMTPQLAQAILRAAGE